MTTRYDIERALEAARLPAASVSVVMWLCTRMDKGSTTIPPGQSPSLTRLARMTKLHRRTVMRHLIVLEERGWLTRKRPELHLARTLHRTTHYSVMIPGVFPQASELGAGNPGTRDTKPLELGAEDSEARGTMPHEPDLPDPSQRDVEVLLAKQELGKRTGKTISTEWAGKVRDQLVAEPGVRNPPGWIRHRIATEPDPAVFLERPSPPRFTRERNQ
jgi:DNA-binding transcriptional ArsR family regulator